MIGVERELASKPAGFRTHILVAGAATLLIILGSLLVEQAESVLQGSVVRADPIRMTEAIVTGVSFLGAGTIIRSRRHSGVEGLTTAASLLMTSAVGVAVAINEIPLAVGATLLVLLTLRAMRWIERRVAQRKAAAA